MLNLYIQYILHSFLTIFQTFLEEICNAEEELKNLQFERSQCVTMTDVQETYKREDEAVAKLLDALTHFYNWELQPFLDLREVGYLNSC